MSELREFIPKPIPAFQLTEEMISEKTYPAEAVVYIREMRTVGAEPTDDPCILLLDGDGDPTVVAAGDYIVQQPSGLFCKATPGVFESAHVEVFNLEEE